MKILTVIILTAVSLLTAEIKEIKKNIPAKDARTVELLGFNGSSIDVKSWDKNEISINIKVDYSLSDKEKEKMIIQHTDIIQEQIGDRIVLRFKEPTIKNDSLSFKDLFNSLFTTTYSNLTVSGVINIPSTYNLTSDMRYGSYSIDGLQGILELSGMSNTLKVKNCSSVQKIENNYGTTTVEHCGGNLNLKSESSKIIINDFKGSVNADANYSTIKFDGITTDATVVCSNGSLDINDIGGNISLNAPYSTMNVNNVKGSAAIESQSGTIRVKNSNGVNIKAPYSNITIESVTGFGSPVYVQNTQGQVEILDVTRDVIIDDSYSSLKATNIQGKVHINGSGSTFIGKKIIGNIFMKNEYGDIRVDELSASTVEISNKNNKVNIELLTKPTKIDIVNEYGPVYVSFPDYTGDVRLKASYGSIKTNLPIEVEEMGGGAIAIGKVENGNSSINIKTISGSIEVIKDTQTKKTR